MPRWSTVPALASTLASRTTVLLSSHRGAAATATAIGSAIAVARPATDRFYYDAMVYWSSSVELVTGGDFFTIGGLVLRGALSTLVYAPAALATTVLGPLSATAVVLVQNAILIGVLGGAVLPALARLFLVVRFELVYASAVMTAVLLGGFAPYPLVDLWAAALVLLGVLAVGRSAGVVRLIAAGALVAAAVNIRPAYVAPVVLILASWGAIIRLRALWSAVGVAAAIVPQIVVNLVYTRSAAPWPVNTFIITDVQTTYAGYTVRYDTLVYVPEVDAQLFYCSPSMAGRFADGAPDSITGLASAYLQHLPTSLWFMAQKVSASLSWTTATPYTDLPRSEPSAMTALVVSVAVVGAVGIVWFLARRRGPGVAVVAAPVAALWLGSVATIGFSAPEARFALPVVLVGVLGCLVVAAAVSGSRGFSRRAFVWSGLCAVIVGVVVAIGVSGLAHPGAPGDVTPSLCRVR